MREILFRGKRLDNGEWVYGYYIKTILPGQIEKAWIIPEESRAMSPIEVDPATVGQFTGLKEKNGRGRKIFEGDIIECWSEGVRAQGTVQQNKGGLWIIYPAWQKRVMWGLCPDEDMTADVEIMGNIHDNPELLEGGVECER